MKIAMLSMTSGLVDRGVETFVHAVATRLSLRGHNVTVYQGKRQRANYRIVPIGGVRQLLTDVEGRFPANLLRFLYADSYSRSVRQFTRQCLPMLAQEKPDILIPLNGGWQTRWVRNVGRRYGGKIVNPGQAGIGYDDWWNLQQDPDAFVALTPQAEIWAAKVRPDIRVEKIPNGVDLDQFTPNGTTYRLETLPPRILCVSGLDRYKQIDCLLYAAVRLEAGSVVIAGSGREEERRRIDFLGRLFLGEKRYQRLRLPHAKMPEIYRACDLFSLPSRDTEAFGMSILEALACNLPVVLPDDPNRRWIAGAAGIFVDVLDEEAYAYGLSRAMVRRKNTPSRLQAARFSWDSVTDAYERLFNELLGEQ